MKKPLALTSILAVTILIGIHLPMRAQAANLAPQKSTFPTNQTNSVEGTPTAKSSPGNDATVTASVPHGTYENYGVLQQVQLGATSLINPSAAKRAAVVNAYSLPTVIDTSWNSGSALDAARDYMVFAKKIADDKYVTLSAEKQKNIKEKLSKIFGAEDFRQGNHPTKYSPETKDRLKKALEESGLTGEFTILSYKKLPSKDSKKLIAWSPLPAKVEKPVQQK